MLREASNSKQARLGEGHGGGEDRETSLGPSPSAWSVHSLPGGAHESLLDSDLTWLVSTVWSACLLLPLLLLLPRPGCVIYILVSLSPVPGLCVPRVPNRGRMYYYSSTL